MPAQNTIVEIPTTKNATPEQLVKAMADSIADRQTAMQAVTRIRYNPSLAPALRKRLNLDADNPIFSYHGIPVQEDKDVAGFRLVVAAKHESPATAPVVGSPEPDLQPAVRPSPAGSSAGNDGFPCRKGCGKVCVNPQGRAKHESACKRSPDGKHQKDPAPRPAKATRPSGGRRTKVHPASEAPPAPRPDAWLRSQDDKQFLLSLLRATWSDNLTRHNVSLNEHDRARAARLWVRLEATDA